MAATSHDFWLMLLTPRAWKTLHMALYVAYGLVVLHVALGIMQYVHTPLIPAMLFGGCGIVAACICSLPDASATAQARLPLTAGLRSVRRPRSPDKGARIVAAPGGERIAVIRDGAEIGALTNLCAHQNGPDRRRPHHRWLRHLSLARLSVSARRRLRAPPFTERLATYRVRIRNGIIEVDPKALPPGTPASITCPAMAVSQ